MNISKAVYGCDGTCGGDRVDALTSPDGNVHLIVIDACGHGAPAEDLANVILNFVASCLLQGLTPANVFRSLNALLLEKACDRDTTRFGSGAIVSLNSQGSLVTFASAGHVDVLRFRSDGKGHDHLASTGPLCGVVLDAEYNDKVFSYAHGDAFVLVTDGLLDARPIDTSSPLLGIGGLCSIVHDMLASTGVISAEGLISAVKRATHRFRDDVAALVAAISPVDVMRARLMPTSGWQAGPSCTVTIGTLQIDADTSLRHDRT